MDRIECDRKDENLTVFEVTYMYDRAEQESTNGGCLIDNATSSGEDDWSHLG